MREILFRGKQYRTGKWVYGYLSEDGCGLPVIETASFRSAVEPETIGQFTGLTDKNGEKIFEGDLITTAWWHGHVDKVVFNKGMFKVEYIPLFSWVANETYEVAVVGNVLDNPELLEGD